MNNLKNIIFQPIYISIIFTLIVVFYLIEFSTENSSSKSQAPIKVEREFRAAWVATVANINWPSEPGLPVEQQKQEALDILNSLQANNFNAVIFQVRPQADALYESDIEPWSYYLTAEQGKAPVPFYDPLSFWIDEAHKRGLELHAWLNPYRAHHIKGDKISDQSVVNLRPELVVELAMGYRWLIPTKQETIDYSLKVVMDIVKRYEIDGIHFDDYFYPYPSYNEGKDFPDAEDYQHYQLEGGDLSVADWRRDHVNQFIKLVYDGIKSEKKHVKFGLSPFGIWKPGNPSTIEGMNQFDKLYADAKLWLNEGWIDYFVPQLYWKISQYPQSFPLLLSWWEKENIKNRHLWPGIQTQLGEDETAMVESINQIMISRAMLNDRPGSVFWNVKALQDNPEFNERLTSGPYKKQALIPEYSWLDSIKPKSPTLSFNATPKQLEVTWRHDQLADIAHWVLYTRYDNQWSYQILPSKTNALSIGSYKFPEEVKRYGQYQPEIEVPAKPEAITEIALTAVDRFGNESPWQSLIINEYLDLSSNIEP